MSGFKDRAIYEMYNCFQSSFSKKVHGDVFSLSNSLTLESWSTQILSIFEKSSFPIKTHLDCFR